MLKVSNSSIQCYKSCRRMYYLKYILGYIPTAEIDALKRGTSYHEGVANVLSGKPNTCEDPKIFAMVDAFQKMSSGWIRAVACEKYFEYTTPTGHTVIGYVDAVSDDGSVIEHKTVSGLIDGAYLKRIDLDEQVPTYMLGMNTRTALYTVCSTPTIKQRKEESTENFKQRCIDWFDDERKIDCIKILKTQDELDEFLQVQDAVINEMEHCNNFYRNPNHCLKWGRLCEYAPICTEKNPCGNYVGFIQDSTRSRR